MSRRSAAAKREAFLAVPETCPTVDNALERVSVRTNEKIEALHEVLAGGGDVTDSLRDVVVELEDALSDADDEIKGRTGALR